METIFESNITNLLVVWFLLYTFLKNPLVKSIEFYGKTQEQNRSNLESYFLQARLNYLRFQTTTKNSNSLLNFVESLDSNNIYTDYNSFDWKQKPTSSPIVSERFSSKFLRLLNR